MQSLAVLINCAALLLALTSKRVLPKPLWVVLVALPAFALIRRVMGLFELIGHDISDAFVSFVALAISILMLILVRSMTKTFHSVNQDHAGEIKYVASFVPTPTESPISERLASILAKANRNS